MSNTQNLPWAPLFTLERACIPEITVYGTVSVWAGDLGPLFSIGKTTAPLWARSILKPFQFLTLLPTLQQHYPELEPRHYALMMGSHNSELVHLETLADIFSIGDLHESQLLCPACYPLSASETQHLKDQGKDKAARFHPCSGKHLAYLLAAKARKKPLKRYIDPDSAPQKVLKSLLGWYLGREPMSFQMTLDGCGLPTVALSANELANLFCALTQPLPLEKMMAPPKDIQELLTVWGYLRTVMQDNAEMIGGHDRLDSRLMRKAAHKEFPVSMIAKEGADGLLAVGVLPESRYKNGLGILIKIASGYDPKYLELVLRALLRALGFYKGQEDSQDETQTLVHHFNFEPLIGAGFLDDSLVL